MTNNVIKLDALAYQIYAGAFADIEQSVHRQPWRQQQFEACFDGYDDQMIQGYWAVAIFQYCSEIEGKSKNLLGYALFRSVSGEAELLTVGVQQAFQGQGLATQMMQFALGVMPDSILVMHLEVRLSNHSAIALYQRVGFGQTGCRRNYYPAAQGNAQAEDAILMTWSRNQVGVGHPK